MIQNFLWKTPLIEPFYFKKAVTQTHDCIVRLPQKNPKIVVFLLSKKNLTFAETDQLKNCPPDGH